MPATIFNEFISGGFPKDNFPGEVISKPESSTILTFPATSNDIYFGAPVAWDYSNNRGVKLMDERDVYVFGIACQNRNRELNKNIENTIMQAHTFKAGELVSVMVFGIINMFVIPSILNLPPIELRIRIDDAYQGFVTDEDVEISIPGNGLSLTEIIPENQFVSPIQITSYLGFFPV